MSAEADFGRFRADSGPPFDTIFGTFRHFLGGRNFDAFLIKFWALIWRGRRRWVGLRKLILSLQTPKNPKDTDMKSPHASHPEGVQRI